MTVAFSTLICEHLFAITPSGLHICIRCQRLDDDPPVPGPRAV